MNHSFLSGEKVDRGQPNWASTGQRASARPVSLRAGGEVGLRGSKDMVIHGVTLGADAAIVTGKSPVMEIQIENLANCRHAARAGRTSETQVKLSFRNFFACKVTRIWSVP